MILKIFNFILGWLIGIIGYFIDLLINLIPAGIRPDISVISGPIASFWNFIFGWFNWTRDALMIDSTSINLIVDILTITLLYKPIISLVKIIIDWIRNLM